MPIPWDKVILHGPQVLDVAKNLYGKWQTRSTKSELDAEKEDVRQTQPDMLSLRVQALEEAGEKQAALAKDLAEQTQALSIGVTTLKEHAEDLQSKLEDARNAHAAIVRRLDELGAQLQHSNSHVLALKKKIAVLTFVSGTALLAAVAALLVNFYG